AVRIQLLEGANWHEKFAANLEIQRHTCLLEHLFGNRQGNRAHGAYVRRDVFARSAIAASQAADQAAVFVLERQRHAVQLELANVLTSLRPLSSCTRRSHARS